MRIGDGRRAAMDALVAVLTAVACLVIQTGRTGATSPGTSWLDWLAAVVPCVPLLWRSRWPVAVFWGVCALIGLGGLLGARTPAIFLVPLVALFAVARNRSAVHTWSAVGFTVLAGLLGRPEDSTAWTGFAAVSVVTVAVALIGINQRTRQAYLSALEEHALRLEIERDQRARLAVADERARIAREMHDVVAHHLTVMVALSEGAAASVPAAPGRAATVMTQVSATGRQALTEMRRIVGLLREGGVLSESGAAGEGGAVSENSAVSNSGELHEDDAVHEDGVVSNGGAVSNGSAVSELPTGLSRPSGPSGSGGNRPAENGNGGLGGIGAGADRGPQPGLGDLDALVDRVRRAGPRVTLVREGAAGAWGPAAGLTVYRIVQEALTNTLKHVGTRVGVEVRLVFGPGSAEISVVDDGGGAVAREPEPANRHGLVGMAERAAAYGGRVEAGPRPGAGWRVHVRLEFDELPPAPTGNETDDERLATPARAGNEESVTA
ncbi:hypothetical protein JIG36_13720 [Actinoplanes sp. LDG1-06]|uniref:histidine kinase n=1 Tax=Paractinoplanes ovalisporus TaxID=2810368 RepID=A0ABS2A9V9_9ACTN|nr:sensor histidine kinase [Actinoplanes ovalisporus]MBM2616618.1 hypothetical protein [Actinoplanes ovalisporus]